MIYRPDPSSFLALPTGIAVAENDPLLTSRTLPEAGHPYRSAFARDIHRILHTKAFRRLAGKTQVFTRNGTESDHSRSRLTHTLEVTQIARTAAASLGLNASFAEALALAHDIGHPPFGHAGEDALDAALRSFGERSGQHLGFDHNLHALRIVTSFEDRYPAFPGLNLTLGVREGIVKHSHDYSAQDHPELVEYFLDQRPPLEAQLIDLADEIAYLTADIDDGLASGVLDLAALRDQVELFASFYRQAELEFPAALPRLLTNEALKNMLNALVTDLMAYTAGCVHEHGIQSLLELRNCPNRLAQLSPAMEAKRKQAKDFLYANLYLSPALTAEHDHAEEVVKNLFNAWTDNPELLPSDHLARVEQEGAARAVADYIAGMTDAYIEQAWIAHKHLSQIA